MFGLSEFFGPHRVQVQGQNSVSSSHPIIVCQSELPEFLAQLAEFAAELGEFYLLKQYSRKQYSARFLKYRPL